MGLAVAQAARLLQRGGVHQLGQQGMLGGQQQGAGAVDGVDAGGEDAQGAVAMGGQGKLQLGAFAAADPVALHGAHPLRPARKPVEVAQQLVGVGGGAQVPLVELALLDRGVLVAPAHPARHLLVGQHGGALGAPIHQPLLAVGQAALEEAQEQPLVPAVVLRQAGGDLARPVVAEAEALVLALHVGDIGQRPGAGMGVVLDGGVLRRQAKRVPAHGMEHVQAAHPEIAGEGVADGVVAHVAHVQRAAGIGQHLQHVVLGRTGIGAGKGVGGGPAFGPLGLEAGRLVGGLVHEPTIVPCFAPISAACGCWPGPARDGAGRRGRAPGRRVRPPGSRG